MVEQGGELRGLQTREVIGMIVLEVWKGKWSQEKERKHMRFCGWPAVYFSQKMSCMLQAQSGKFLKKLIKILEAYYSRNHWLVGHAPQVTEIIDVFYAGTVAYSR